MEGSWERRKTVVSQPKNITPSNSFLGRESCRVYFPFFFNFFFTSLFSPVSAACSGELCGEAVQLVQGGGPHPFPYGSTGAGPGQG